VKKKKNGDKREDFFQKSSGAREVTRGSHSQKGRKDTSRQRNLSENIRSWAPWKVISTSIAQAIRPRKRERGQSQQLREELEIVSDLYHFAGGTTKKRNSCGAQKVKDELLATNEWGPVIRTEPHLSKRTGGVTHVKDRHPAVNKILVL